MGIAGSAVIGKYVTIAGQAGVAGHIEIGDQEIVGAQAGVTKSIHGKETWFGMPAVPAQEFRRQVAYVYGIPKLKERVRIIEKQLGKAQEMVPEG